MNGPESASERRRMVKKAKRQGVSKEDASRVIQHEWTNMKFEGHLLRSTIESVYGE